MNRYNEVQLEENYNKFIEALKKSFDGERLEKLLHMYSMEERSFKPNVISEWKCKLPQWLTKVVISTML